MKRVFFVFLFFCNVLFSELTSNINSLSSIKSLKLNAKESFNDGKNKRIAEYELSIELPDRMKKVQFLPEINKGEIYIYSKDERIVYLPFFNEVTKGKIPVGEASVVDYLNRIIELEKKDKNFKEDFNKNSSVVFQSKDNERIILNNIKNIDGFRFPTNIEVYSGENKVLDIILDNISFNPKFEKDEFQLKNE
ncbi:MAG: LolA family protein [Fusobacteriaceae bacterium]